MARFGALAQLQLDHLHLRVQRVGLEAFGVEAAVVVAAAEVTRANLPDQITAVHPVVLRDRAFTRVVGKATHLGALVQRQHRVGRQRAKTHGRDVEHTHAVGLGAGRRRGRRLLRRAAHPDAEVVGRQLGRCHGMVDPLVPLHTHIQLRAKRAVVGLTLGALVHQRTLRPRKRRGFAVTLDEILPDFGADVFQRKPQVADDGVVAQNGVPVLPQVVNAQRHQCTQHQQGQPAHPQAHDGKNTQQKAKNAERQRRIAHRVEGVELAEHGGVSRIVLWAWRTLHFASTALCTPS